MNPVRRNLFVPPLWVGPADGRIRVKDGLRSTDVLLPGLVRDRGRPALEEAGDGPPAAAVPLDAGLPGMAAVELRGEVGAVPPGLPERSGR